MGADKDHVSEDESDEEEEIDENDRENQWVSYIRGGTQKKVSSSGFDAKLYMGDEHTDWRSLSFELEEDPIELRNNFQDLYKSKEK
eukprot:2854775-Rhodomonas_salina.1